MWCYVRRHLVSLAYHCCVFGNVPTFRSFKFVKARFEFVVSNNSDTHTRYHDTSLVSLANVAACIPIPSFNSFDPRRRTNIPCWHQVRQSTPLPHSAQPPNSVVTSPPASYRLAAHAEHMRCLRCCTPPPATATSVRTSHSPPEAS